MLEKAPGVCASGAFFRVTGNAALVIRRWIAAPCASLALLACSPAPAGAPDRLTEERSIAGEYVVTFVDQAEPSIGIEGSQPEVTIGGDRVHFQSQCIYADWSYTREGERFATGPINDGEPVEMCARSWASGEQAIADAFSSAKSVRFVRSGLYFEGGGHSVQLRRVASAEQLAGRIVDLTGLWTVQAVDRAVLPYLLELEADFEQIWWDPGCALQYRDYTISKAAFATRPRRPGRETVCDIGIPPELEQVWAALDAAETVERTVNGGALISGGGRSVLLAPRVKDGG